MTIPEEQSLHEKALYVKALYKKGLQYPAWSKERGKFHTESYWLFSNYFRPQPEPYQWFHKEWMEIVCTYQYFCVLAPRDHSKTTSFAQNYTIWRLFMEPESTVMLVTSSASIAETSMRVIASIIKTDDTLKKYFGNLYPDKPSKWTNTEIVVERKPGVAHASVIALGVNSAILSRRANYIIADDIVRDDEVQLVQQRERLKDWIHGVLIGVSEPEDQVGFIGTKKHAADYYSDLELNEQYFYRRYDAIQEERQDGSWATLWPSKWSEKALRNKKALIGSYEFNRNYRNIAMGREDSPFPLEWLEECKDYKLPIIWAYPHQEVGIKKVISVDLSAGTGHGSYFVAMVVALLPGGHYAVLNMKRSNNLDFPSQVRAVSDLIEDFNPDCVVVETNAYQRAMYDTLVLKYPNINIESHVTGKNKNSPTEGLPMIQPIVEDKRLHLPYANDSAAAMSDIIIDELHTVLVARFTDTVMALWFAVKWLGQFAKIETRLRAMIL